MKNSQTRGSLSAFYSKHFIPVGPTVNIYWFLPPQKCITRIHFHIFPTAQKSVTSIVNINIGFMLYAAHQRGLLTPDKDAPRRDPVHGGPEVSAWPAGALASSHRPWTYRFNHRRRLSANLLSSLFLGGYFGHLLKIDWHQVRCLCMYNFDLKYFVLSIPIFSI